MSKWKDRGYVLDSDEEDIALDSPDDPTTDTHTSGDINGLTQGNKLPSSRISDHTSALPHLTNGHEEIIKTGNQEQDASLQEAGNVLSQELGEDVGVEQRQAVQASKDTQASSDERALLDDSHSVSTTAPAQAKAAKRQPIVLITQPPRAYSPPEAAPKNVRTYSRRGKLRQDETSVTPALDVTGQEKEQNLEDQDDFMDIDMLVEGGADSEPPHFISEATPAVTQSNRRLSVSSSDLSDVDMQILSSPQPFFTRPSSATARKAPSASPENLTPASIVQTVAPSFAAKHLAAFAAPSRNFRARKEIQLHPYQVEIERYRRTLKARGVRPIHVANSSQRQREQADSQDADFSQAESQSQPLRPSHTQETTPPDSSANSNQPPRNDLLDLVANDENEFPDIDAAIRRNVLGGIQEGFKRRKTYETPRHVRPFHKSLSSSGAKGRLKSVHASRKSSDAGDQVLLPLSPPRTSSPSNVDPVSAAPSGFRLPRGLTPVTVSTPLPPTPERVASGSVSRSRQLVISSDEDNDGQEGAVSDQSSSTDVDAEERQLMRMRRKMRGVLPASYVKFDRPARRLSSKAAGEAQLETPQPTAPVKGVAQRRTAGSSVTRPRQSSYIFFSDNSESDDAPEQLQTPDLIQARLTLPNINHKLGQHYRVDEVEEHDEIDAMFASNSRPRAPKFSTKKRQSRLTDVFSNVSDHTKSNNSKRSRHNHDPAGARRPKPNKQGGSRPTRKPKTKKQIQLSILDATISPSSSQTPNPQFVRLAARQARRRPDHGRHSPKNKDIRLATREDTEDAAAPLRSWKAGNISRRWKPELPTDMRSTNSASSASKPSRSVQNNGQQPRFVDLTKGLGPNKSRLAPGAGSTSGAHARGHELSKSGDTTRARPDQKRQLVRNHRMRPAQLETVAQGNSRDMDLLTFAPPPSRLMEIFNRDRGAPPASRFRLERFLQDKDDVSGTTISHPTGYVDVSGQINIATPKQRARKRLARRLDVETAQFRQPDEPLPIELPSIVAIEPTSHAEEVEVMQGLGSSGTRYPTDFDIRPLEIGTYFSANTFVGSGDFSDCLTLRERCLDDPAGRITIEISGHMLHWDAWTEDVSADLAKVISACGQDLRTINDFEDDAARITVLGEITARFDYSLRSIIRYLSGCLYYLDPIDRPSSLNRLSRFVDEFMEMVEVETAVLRSQTTVRPCADRLFIDSLLFLVCITVQSLRIAKHPSVEFKVQTSLVEKIIRFCRKIVAATLPEQFTTIREFLEGHRRHALRETGIQEKDVAVKSIVIVHHILTAIDLPSGLSDMLAAQLGHSVSKLRNVHALDQIWYDVFSVQPLLEFDTRGVFIPRSRFWAGNDGWSLIKPLLKRTFDLYPATIKERSPSLNDYVRANLVRVYHFISRWGWQKCEPALSTIYDFFAKNHLSQLYKEQSKGSPRFLEDLDKDPQIELDNGDCAFHIFLKLLVVGLRKMQEVYPKNKVRGFAWRFIPNHGRTYLKDQELNQVALDALRNHHDLLCTLYWVLPTGSGPRLQMIKDLVDHDNSHREACRLSVHAWGIIARYQLSRDDLFDDLDVLASWFKYMVSMSILQYRLARSDAEAQYALEISRGSTDISPELLEATIAANQRSIFATLQDLLLALRQAIRISKTWAATRKLVESSDVVEVLKIFDFEQPRLSLAVAQTLDVIGELIVARNRLCQPASLESQQGSDDSQDYGDWSFMDQVMDHEVANTERKATEIGFVQEPLANLVSTCFGSEKSPDDDLLKKVVDTWTATASQYVKDKTHDWSSFLDTYSSTSWFQLRETEQRHKYTCYFLASVISCDKSSLNNHRDLFMKAWFVSLLERESTLKFQHLLTSSLLENATQEPLLHNLPFAANHETGRYNITLTEIRETRVSLIGSLLANMHSSLESDIYSHASGSAELRREYVDLLKHSMQYMRRTYEELQEMSGRLGSSHLGAKGAYVTFVQQVISLMQQYTSDICPIDSFFVDSSAFPLPADDPTYVVGRLKSYVPKLADARSRKQLAIFIQTVSERAALDNVQPYLVSQLYQALSGTASRKLRKVFVTALLPAYMSCAASTPCGWIVALPHIEACALVVEDLIYDMQLNDDAMINANIETVFALLQNMHNWIETQVEAIQTFLRHPGLMHLSAAIFGVVEASLTIVDYINRATSKGADAMTLVQSFAALGEYLTSFINFSSFDDQDDLELPLAPDPPHISAPPCALQDTLDFSTRNLHGQLSKSWSQRDGDCFVTQGNGIREVETGVVSIEEERMKLQAAISMFKRKYDVVVRGGHGEEIQADDVEQEEMVRGLADMLWV